MLNQISQEQNRQSYQFPIEISIGKEKHNVQSLNIDGKYQYLVESKKCFDAETFISRSYTKSDKKFNLSCKESWFDQYSCHLYSP